MADEKLTLSDDFEYDRRECYACGGFYGPSFSDPLCATCHSFLFPYDAQSSGTTLESSSDDNDSGNDEPSDPSQLVLSGSINAPNSILNNARNRRRGDGEASPDPDEGAAGVEEDLDEPLQQEANNHDIDVDEAINQQEAPYRMYDEKYIYPVAQNPPNPIPQTVSQRINLLSVPQHYHLMPSSNFSVLELPPEILLVIFSMLDDLSMWAASQVCDQWKRIILSHTSDEKWKVYTNDRFPLFRPIAFVLNWYTAFTALVESSCCMQCLHDMAGRRTPPGKETSWRRRRLLQEVRSIRQEPAQGISASPLDADYCHWQATISGPTGSPYEGGIFYLYLKVPYSYPMEPPEVRFITRIFHPNISRHGDVGVDSITHNWSLALTISKVLVSVQSLLTDPYCQVCMEPLVGRLYTVNRECFNRIAKAWTYKYAMTDMVILSENRNDVTRSEEEEDYQNPGTSEGGMNYKRCKCAITPT